MLQLEVEESTEAARAVETSKGRMWGRACTGRAELGG